MDNPRPIHDRIRQRLEFVYGPDRAGDIHAGIRRVIDKHAPALRGRAAGARWSQADALLITYADSIRSPGRTPLGVLREFLSRHVGREISMVHLLPFYPWTSDDGFAVTDFRAIAPGLGTWDDIADLSRDYRLVFDGVINHVSSESIYARGYFADDPAYKDFFISLPPDTDTSKVLRTRNLPLLHDYPTPEGTRWLWTTFSRDQLDLNYANPAVLLEILDVLLFYAARGASIIRLDAIPYLWKRLGTSCAHLPETHELIKLLRDVFDLAAPDVLLLTETNNPHRENVSYFGDGGDEAQMIYNFTLAPLILHALVRGDASVLSDWAKQVRFISPRATYLNITATHDGIGMRPTEGILPEPERQMLVDLAYARGGAMTGKRNSDGSVSPYELNITYFDALSDPAGGEPIERQVARFLCAQAISISFIGIPGIYIHSLLGSRNDLEGVKRTGRARSINRAQLDLATLEAALSSESNLRNRVFAGITRLLQHRRTQPALHPDAQQTVLDLGPAFFAIERTPESGPSLRAIHNVTNEPRTLPASALPGRWIDVLDPAAANPALLPPYGVRWLVTQ